MRVSLREYGSTIVFIILSANSCASNVTFEKNEHVLITECIFPLTYTKFETERSRKKKKGGGVITEGARFSQRIL